jgi:hypothetical protein
VWKKNPEMDMETLQRAMNENDGSLRRKMIKVSALPCDDGFSLSSHSHMTEAISNLQRGDDVYITKKQKPLSVWTAVGTTLAPTQVITAVACTVM